MEFTGESILITGASGGIGRALALECAKRGARIGGIARRADLLGTLAEEIRTLGGTAEMEACDVGERSAVLDAVARIRAKLGPIDRVVANAGVGGTNRLDDLNGAVAETIIRVNLLGVMATIEACLPEMLARGTGQVVAVSSVAAQKGLPGSAAYCASKAAVNIYMESLRIQQRGRGVSFLTIAPGFIRTPMTANNAKMFLVLEPEDAARRMADAMKRRKATFAFPWLTDRLVKLTRCLPDAWVARALRE